MTIDDILQLVDAESLCRFGDPAKNMKYAFAADLMSDVLMRANTEEMILITGMANLQVIRTAEMADIPVVLFVRGKKVTDEMRELAEDNGITLLHSKQSMFKVCGELYKAGLEPLF